MSEIFFSIQSEIMKKGKPVTRWTGTWSEAVSYLQSSKEELPNKLAGRLLNPFTYEGDSALAANAETATLLVFDLDDISEETLASVRRRIEGLSYILHSTYSHSPPSNARYRLILPLDSPVTAENYTAFWKEARSIYAPESDGVTSDSARGFFFPSVRSSDSPYLFDHRNGQPVSTKSIQRVIDTRSKEVAKAERAAAGAREARLREIQNQEETPSVDPSDFRGWALSRLQRKLDQILAIPAGSPGAYGAIRDASYMAGGFVASGCLDYSEALSVVTAAALTRDPTHLKSTSYAEKGLRDGAAHPLYPTVDLSHYARSQKGDAIRWAHYLDGSIRYIFDRRGNPSPIAYSAPLWSFEDGPTVLSSAWEALCRDEKSQIELIEDPEHKLSMIRWSASRETARHVKAAEELLERTSELHIREDVFYDLSRFGETAPLVYGSDLILIDGTSVTVRPVEKEDYLITGNTSTTYDPSATCPTFEKMFSDLFAGDTDVVEYMHQQLGRSFSAKNSESIIHFIRSPDDGDKNGSNGKNTIFDLIQAAVGSAYFLKVDDKYLSKRPDPSTHYTSANFIDKRIIWIDELPESADFDETKLKSLSNNGTISVRRPYFTPIETKMTGSFFITTNRMPLITGTDGGTKRRYRVVPTTTVRHTPGNATGTALKTHVLERELPGIITWLIEGAVKYATYITTYGAPFYPSRIEAASKAHFFEQDSVAQFLAHSCYLDPDKETSRRDVYVAYSRYMENSAEGNPLGQRTFSTRLRDYGITDGGSTNGIRRWRGIGLNSDIAFQAQTVEQQNMKNNLPINPLPNPRQVQEFRAQGAL